MGKGVGQGGRVGKGVGIGKESGVGSGIRREGEWLGGREWDREGRVGRE